MRRRRRLNVLRSTYPAPTRQDLDGEEHACESAHLPSCHGTLNYGAAPSFTKILILCLVLGLLSGLIAGLAFGMYSYVGFVFPVVVVFNSKLDSYRR